jgi:HAD superfamily hydrolase (TIGR01549 family)
VKAVLFDVDGTLYSQRVLRALIFLELMGAACMSPVRSVRTVRRLQAFRRERERLRHLVQGGGLERRQYAVVQQRHGFAEGEVEEVVQEWIARRPLKYLRQARHAGLEDFLRECRALDLKIGAFSDYPSEAKIDALGVGRYFDLHLCSTDPQIDAFKPSSRGILQAAGQWGLRPQEIVYIGDRFEIDGAAAEAAGCRFILIGKERTPDCISVRKYAELNRLFQEWNLTSREVKKRDG